jgi:ABC-type polar amino acid transport system ATPase subunit
LEKLKLISEKCVEDTKAIKVKVDAWGEYAEAIHNACEAKDGKILVRNQCSPREEGRSADWRLCSDLLEKDEKELGDQVKLKDAAKHMKEAQVEVTKQKTKEYRAKMEKYQEKVDMAEKANNRGKQSSGAR